MILCLSFSLLVFFVYCIKHGHLVKYFNLLLISCLKLLLYPCFEFMVCGYSFNFLIRSCLYTIFEFCFLKHFFFLGCNHRNILIVTEVPKNYCENSYGTYISGGFELLWECFSLQLKTAIKTQFFYSAGCQFPLILDSI